MDFSPMLIDHVFVSLIPWLIGIVAGGGLGMLNGLALSYLAADRPPLFKLLRLSPWRTFILIGFVFMNTSSDFIPKYVGLGEIGAQTSIALAIGILALPITTGILLERRYSSPLIGRFLAQARTLAVVAIGLATYVAPLFKSGGIGILLPGGDVALEFPLLEALYALAALSLLVDIGLGVLQNLTASQLQPS